MYNVYMYSFISVIELTRGRFMVGLIGVVASMTSLVGVVLHLTSVLEWTFVRNRTFPRRFQEVMTSCWGLTVINVSVYNINKY